MMQVSIDICRGRSFCPPCRDLRVTKTKRPARAGLWRWLRRGGLALAAVLVLCIGHAVLLQLTGNLHTVVAGELYRSAQPSGADIASQHQRFGIRTILNLRGASPGAPWYEGERAAAQQLGIGHLDFAMSESLVLSRAEAEQLVTLMREAPKPLLIHCRAGSDRTGLAASLYMAAIAGADEEEAEAQLSFRFGHVPLPWLSRAWPMDESFEQLELWLGFTAS